MALAIWWANQHGYLLGHTLAELMSAVVAWTALAVATTSVLAAPYGTRLAHALSGPMLKRVFALFLLVVGSAFAYSALH